MKDFRFTDGEGFSIGTVGETHFKFTFSIGLHIYDLKT